MKILFSLLLFPVLCVGNISQITINGWNVDVYVPGSYKPPILLFIPGNGEVGNNRELLYSNGPLKFVREGWNPDFMIVAAQPPALWPNHTFINTVLTEIIERYTVDTSRIYFTGLSAGAWAIYKYMANLQSMRYKPKAVVPMSMVIETSCTSYLCNSDFNWSTVASWGFCGSGDSPFFKMKRFWELMAAAGYVTRWTTYTGGHGGWNGFYNPSYRENGRNIYEWCLQYPFISLPVKWLYVRKNANLIEWATDQEENLIHYIVQESTDGINWADISPAIEPNQSKKYTYKL